MICSACLADPMVQYELAVESVLPPAPPAPRLLLTFNPTRKRRPRWNKRTHWIATPNDRKDSIYPPLTNRKEYSHA
jgi:hypothetical protein